MLFCLQIDQETRNFLRISALASKKRSNQKSSVRESKGLFEINWRLMRYHKKFNSFCIKKTTGAINKKLVKKAERKILCICNLTSLMSMQNFQTSKTPKTIVQRSNLISYEIDTLSSLINALIYQTTSSEFFQKVSIKQPGPSQKKNGSHCPLSRAAKANY